MPSPFTPEQLASLSAQLDQQRAQLQDTSVESPIKNGNLIKQDNPECLPVQWQAIKVITKGGSGRPDAVSCA